MKRTYFHAFVGTTVVLLVGGGLLTQASGKPRHRTNRANFVRPGLGKSVVRDIDTAIPTGFVDVSLDSSANEHSQGMLAVSPTSSTTLATFFYDARNAWDAQPSYTTDGGNSWALSTMPSAPSAIQETGISDPTTTADSSGRFYVAGSGPLTPTSGTLLSTYVFPSTDAAAVFNTPTTPFTLVSGSSNDFLDHQSTFADASGTTSNVYSSVSQIATIANDDGNQSQNVLFNQSTDGAQTWAYPSSTGVQVNDEAGTGNAGSATPDTRVDSSGKVYVDWTQISQTDQVYIELDKAAIPSGGGFGTDVVVAGPLNANVNLFDGFLGEIRAGIFNCLAVDTSTTSTNGNVYEAWTDQVSSLGGTFKLFVARSQDGGNTFSSGVRVDTSLDSLGTNSDHQTIPTMAVNPATGQLIVTYYSTHYNTTDRGGPDSPINENEIANQTPLVDLFVAIGTPNSSGSIDFAGPYRVTPSSIDVLAAYNAGNVQYDPTLGDYNGLAFRTTSNGVNSVLEFTTVDNDNRIVEIAAQQFDGTATLSSVSGGTFEFVANATAPVGGLSGSVNWGDGTTSTGLDVTHNYAAGSYTATANVSDGSSSSASFSFSVTSTGAFSSGSATSGTSTVVTANTLVAAGTNGTLGNGSSTTSGTSSTTSGTTSGTTSTTTGSGTTTASTTGGSGSTSTSSSTTTGGTSSSSTGTTTGSSTSTTATTTGSTGSSDIATGNGGGGGGCFIATAAYGSYWEPHVQTLRKLRDEDLLTNAPGRLFVKEYYQHSPPVADWIRGRSWARAAVRVGLTPLVLGFEHPAEAFFGALGGLALGAGLFARRRRRIGVAANETP